MIKLKVLLILIRVLHFGLEGMQQWHIGYQGKVCIDFQVVYILIIYNTDIKIDLSDCNYVLCMIETRVYLCFNSKPEDDLLSLG